MHYSWIDGPASRPGRARRSPARPVRSERNARARPSVARHRAFPAGEDAGTGPVQGLFTERTGVCVIGRLLKTTSSIQIHDPHPGARVLSALYGLCLTEEEARQTDVPHREAPAAPHHGAGLGPDTELSVCGVPCALHVGLHPPRCPFVSVLLHLRKTREAGIEGPGGSTLPVGGGMVTSWSAGSMHVAGNRAATPRPGPPSPGRRAA